MPQVYQTYVTQISNNRASGLVLARRGMGIYHEWLPARYAFQTSIQAEARQHVFVHWQRFHKYYLEQGSRNAWFSPNLTGSTGDSSVNTGSTTNEVVKRTPKASVGGRECKPRLFVKA